MLVSGLVNILLTEYRSSTNCTQDVPIKYKTTSCGDWSIGYLSPTYNIVYNTSIPVVCEKNSYYFRKKFWSDVL